MPRRVTTREIQQLLLDSFNQYNESHPSNPLTYEEIAYQVPKYLAPKLEVTPDMPFEKFKRGYRKGDEDYIKREYDRYIDRYEANIYSVNFVMDEDEWYGFFHGTYMPDICEEQFNEFFLSCLRVVHANEDYIFLAFSSCSFLDEEWYLKKYVEDTITYYRKEAKVSALALSKKTSYGHSAISNLFNLKSYSHKCFEAIADEMKIPKDVISRCATYLSILEDKTPFMFGMRYANEIQFYDYTKKYTHLVGEESE